jgi:hypothetical protein
VSNRTWRTSLQQFTEHFKNLCEDTQEVSEDENGAYVDNFLLNDAINEPFTAGEIIKLCKSLKNNKACGNDLIVNEFIKNSPDEFYTLMEKYFNLILNNGHVPSEWCIGLIQPVFKKKGSVNDIDNYRGITLLSCMGKVFTALINSRWSQYLEDSGTIGEEQTGF